MANSDIFTLHEVIACLAATPHLLRVLVSNLPTAAGGWHPAVGKWCINEIVGHLIEEDQRDFVGRIRLMLAQNDPRLSVTDQDEVAKSRRDCSRQPSDLLDAFCQVRQASVEFASGLERSDLARGGVHPKIGHVHVVELLHEWVYHDMNHVRQIAANIQALLWRQLGNTQQFYQSSRR
jgi:DinB superfamily